MLKVAQGGWVPMAVSAAVIALMTTWRRGRALVHQGLETSTEPLDRFLSRVAAQRPLRVSGSAVFLTHRSRTTPPGLAATFRLSQVLPEQVVLLTVEIENVPRVPSDGRVEVTSFGDGFFRLIAHFGFMDQPDLPRALTDAAALGLSIDASRATYYLRRDVVLSDSRRQGMAIWREKLYRFLQKNSALYCLPPEQVIELGLRGSTCIAVNVARPDSNR